jgi:hypothetical protein
VRNVESAFVRLSASASAVGPLQAVLGGVRSVGKLSLPDFS